MIYNNKNNIMCGMSGGVDSSVAALLLKNEGYNVLGATLVLHEEILETEEVTKAKKICNNLGINHTVIDLRTNFKKFVIDNFIKKYEEALTPNPCIECNKYIKFGKMLEEAIKNNCELLATGHYAQIEKVGEKFFLKKAKDLKKDQTYFLYMLGQEILSIIKLPLGSLTKEEVREIAQENGFFNAKNKDSQDICFIKNNDYVSFLNENSCINKVGNFYDLQGNNLGMHNGIINYTIGQRKGLNIALGKPAYVISKNSVNNAVVLGDDINLFIDTVKIKNVAFSAFDKLQGEIKVSAKLRYRAKEAKCILRQLDNDNYLLKFDEPQRAVTPGQYAVIYDGDICLGGGEII